VWLTRGEWFGRGDRGGDGAAWIMRGIEARGPAGAEALGESTYCEGRGAGSMTEIIREERCEWAREMGREEVCATIMRSLPCWETGRTMMRRGGEGVSSSCSTFTVGGGELAFGLGFRDLQEQVGVWKDVLLTRHMVRVEGRLDGKVLAVEA
jgi:hypothetical protein